MPRKPVPVTPKQSWELFGVQHLTQLEHRARSVSAQTGIDDRELFARTMDVMMRKWPEIWVTPVVDPSSPPHFLAEFSYAKTVMGREFLALKSEKERWSQMPPSEEQLESRAANSRQEDQNPEFILIQKEQENRIYALYQALSDRQHKVLVMRMTLGMSPSEVARELNLTTEQVNQSRSRAITKLRALAIQEGLR